MLFFVMLYMIVMESLWDLDHWFHHIEINKYVSFGCGKFYSYTPSYYPSTFFFPMYLLLSHIPLLVPGKHFYDH